MERLVLDSPHQPRTCEVEGDDEIRRIHFERLAVRFVIDFLTPATKGSGIARCEEEVQFLGRCGGEIDKSRKTILLMEALA